MAIGGVLQKVGGKKIGAGNDASLNEGGQVVQENKVGGGVMSHYMREVKR